MADICDSCAFEDACSSAHFNKTELSICAFYKSIKKYARRNVLEGGAER